MIGHQAITQDAHWQALAGLLHEADQGLVVVRLVEDIRPPIPAVEDVVADPARCVSQGSWHGPQRSAPAWFCQQKSSLTEPVALSING